MIIDKNSLQFKSIMVAKNCKTQVRGYLRTKYFIHILPNFDLLTHTIMDFLHSKYKVDMKNMKFLLPPSRLLTCINFNLPSYYFCKKK